MRRIQWGSVLPVLATASVVGIGMAAGFAHTHAAAVRAGQTGWLAWADAVVIELMALVAGWQLARAHRAGRSVWWPGTVMVIAFLVQMGSQVSGAQATFAGWLFAALPALGALVTVKLLMHGRAAAASVDEAVPVEAEAAAPVVRAEAVRQLDLADPDAVREFAAAAPVTAVVESPAATPVVESPAVLASWPPR